MLDPLKYLKSNISSIFNGKKSFPGLSDWTTRLFYAILLSVWEDVPDPL
jgi:hypothetical protein